MVGWVASSVKTMYSQCLWTPPRANEKVFLLFSVTFSHGITNEWRSLRSMLGRMLQSQGSDCSADQA